MDVSHTSLQGGVVEKGRRAMESAGDSQWTGVGCGCLKGESCLHCLPAPTPVLCEELLAFLQQEQRGTHPGA